MAEWGQGVVEFIHCNLKHEYFYENNFIEWVEKSGNKSRDRLIAFQAKVKLKNFSFKSLFMKSFLHKIVHKISVHH